MIVELSFTIAMFGSAAGGAVPVMHTIKQEFAAPTPQQAYALCDSAAFAKMDSIAKNTKEGSVAIVSVTCNTTMEDD